MRLPRLEAGPLRWLYVGTLLTATGGGGWFVCWTVFATTSIGLSPWRFGLGVGVAGVASLLAGAPLGYVADRVGVNRMLMALVTTQGLAVAAFSLVHSLWSFIPVTCVFLTAERTVPSIRVALVCGLTEDRERLGHLASLRVVQSGGASLGAGIGTLVLYLDTRAAFLTLLYLYGGFALVSVAAIRRLPAVSSLRDRGLKRKAMVVRDAPFLVVTVLFALLALNWGLLAVGVPLWVVGHTSAPTWTIGVMFALNTLGVMFFQRRAGRASATVPGAARSAALCVVPLICACVLFAASGHVMGSAAVVALLAAAAVHTLGELMFVASSWAIAVGLTPQEAHGEYQSVFNSGFTAAEMTAPLVMSALVVGLGTGGWVVLAAVFLVAGTPMPATVAWAQRHPLRRPDPLAKAAGASA